MKKKLFAMLMALSLVFTIGAVAENDWDNYSVSSGNVAAVDYVDVTAPYSGTIMPFDLAAGDSVTEGTALFQMMTTGIYAPEAGKVVRLFATNGDDAEAVTTRYGGVLALEPEKEYVLTASTQTSYESNENRVVHVGEKLYFKTTKAEKTSGTGTVISVSGANYIVEIDEGEFDLKDSMSLYRNKDYTTKSKVGTGVVTRRDPVMIQAAGRVGEIYVGEEDTVEQNQILLQILGKDADPDAQSTINSPVDGVVAQVFVQVGQQVWKGQALARIYAADNLEIVADADEIDIKGLKVGDTVYYTLDTNEAEKLQCTVTEISELGIKKQNAAYFTVHAQMRENNAKIGQSASLYLPK